MTGDALLLPFQFSNHNSTTAENPTNHPKITIKTLLSLVKHVNGQYNTKRRAVHVYEEYNHSVWFFLYQ